MQIKLADNVIEVANLLVEARDLLLECEFLLAQTAPQTLPGLALQKMTGRIDWFLGQLNLGHLDGKDAQ